MRGPLLHVLPLESQRNTRFLEVRWDCGHPGAPSGSSDPAQHQGRHQRPTNTAADAEALDEVCESVMAQSLDGALRLRKGGQH